MGGLALPSVFIVPLDLFGSVGKHSLRGLYVPAIWPFVALAPSTPAALPDVPALADSTVVPESWAAVISDNVVIAGQSTVDVTPLCPTEQ